MITIRRTDNKNRQRPDDADRHTPSGDIINSELKLVDDRDFEWLAWNYKAFKFEQTFKSKQEMVINMIEKPYSVLPSPEEILHGIVLA